MHYQNIIVTCYFWILTAIIAEVVEQKLHTFRFSVGFVLLDLWFNMYVMLIVFCPFVHFLLAIVLWQDSDILCIM